MKTAIVIVVIFILLGISAMFYMRSHTAKQVQSFAECIAAGYPVQETFPATCRTPQGKIFVAPTPTTPTTIPQQTDANIIVTSPKTEDTIRNGLVELAGQARVFENVLQYRVTIENKEIASGSLEAKSPDVGQYGPFNKTITIDQSLHGRGSVDVFSYSPKDGAEINKVVIKVQF